MKNYSTPILKRTISILCIIAFLLSMTSIFSMTAFAAPVKYDCDKTVTFTVKTTSKGTPSVKFACDAIKAYGHRCQAPRMAISISPSVNGKSFYLISGSGRSISSTLKLSKNTTYQVRISFYVHTSNRCKYPDLAYVNVHNLGGNTTYKGLNGRDVYANGSWYISKTNNCTSSNIKVH